MGRLQRKRQKNKATPITLNVKDKIQSYPMYSTYVLQELKWLVAEKEGYADRLSITVNEEEKKNIKVQLDNRLHTLFQNGLIIQTTLDPTKQQHDEEKCQLFLRLAHCKQQVRSLKTNQEK